MKVSDSINETIIKMIVKAESGSRGYFSPSPHNNQHACSFVACTYSMYLQSDQSCDRGLVYGVLGMLKIDRIGFGNLLF
jgi:hypothetical protein